MICVFGGTGAAPWADAVNARSTTVESTMIGLCIGIMTISYIARCRDNVMAANMAGVIGKWRLIFWV